MGLGNLYSLDSSAKGNVLLGCLRTEDHHDKFDDARDVIGLAHQRERTVFEHAKIKQVIYEATQEFELSYGHAAVPLALLYHDGVEGVCAKHGLDPLQKENYVQDWRAHFVTYHRREVLCLLLGVDLFPSQHAKEFLLDLLRSVAHVNGDGRPPDVGLSFDS